MFEDFSNENMIDIYIGLKALIENGSGYGFKNGDMGHPVYTSAAMGKDSSEFGDSPQKNGLFKMLSELSKRLKKNGIKDQHYNWWDDLEDWQKFCEFAVKIHTNLERI